VCPGISRRQGPDHNETNLVQGSLDINAITADVERLLAQ
jgi:hypothetical protein